MKPKVISNVDKLIAAWEKRAQALEPYMRDATKKATDIVYAEGRAQMTRGIYNKPIPTTEQNAKGRGDYVTVGGNVVPAVWRSRKGGAKFLMPMPEELKDKPAWRRTGKLRRSERRYQQTAYLGIIENAAEYAKARHEMGKPTAKLKTERRAHWRDTAVRRTRGKVKEIYRAAMRNAIRAGIIPGAGGM